eukprot:jgi/Chrpa1/21622/Chrysochromulina_OHIO_Genome00027890-RA
MLGLARSSCAVEAGFFRQERRMAPDLPRQQLAALAAEVARLSRDEAVASKRKGKAGVGSTYRPPEPSELPVEEEELLAAYCEEELCRFVLEACAAGREDEAVQLLDDAELEVRELREITGPNGITPLIAAAAAGHTRLVGTLIEVTTTPPLRHVCRNSYPVNRMRTARLIVLLRNGDYSLSLSPKQTSPPPPPAPPSPAPPACVRLPRFFVPSPLPRWRRPRCKSRIPK